jgi:hypothetical protein
MVDGLISAGNRKLRGAAPEKFCAGRSGSSPRAQKTERMSPGHRAAR